MPENIIPGEPGYNTETSYKPWLTDPNWNKQTSNTPIADEKAEYINRRLFSVAIVGFAIWYFGFRKKRGAK